MVSLHDSLIVRYSFDSVNLTHEFWFTDHTQHSDHSINISEPIIDSRQTSPSLRHSSNLTSSPNDRNSRHISKSESSPECGPVSADSFGESQTTINLGKQFESHKSNPCSISIIQDLDTNRPSVVSTSTRSAFLPWGIQTRSSIAAAAGLIDMQSLSDGTLRPGEIVMRTLFADFTKQAEKKIEGVMLESSDKNLSKLLQRGEDPQFDQLLCAFGTVAEHCLPSLLLTLLAWHKRQLSDAEIKMDIKRMEKIATKSNVDLELQLQRRESAVEFIFCLALIEILKQLQFHPGHEDIIKNFENLAFKHFKYRDG